jgi:hypothetical protein
LVQSIGELMLLDAMQEEGESFATLNVEGIRHKAYSFPPQLPNWWQQPFLRSRGTDS